MKRVALYLRVSTDGQTTENQRRELMQVAERAGWEVVEVYEDAGISGAKGRAERPAFDRLHKDAVRRRFDLVMAWSVDRLGRSLSDLLRFLEELRGAGMGLYLHKQALDTTTPSGKMMFQMLGVFAEFERSLIQERVRAGLARAKAEGTRLGRPSVVDARKLKIIREGKKAGLSVRKIAAKAGLSVGTVHAALA
jgi:DNA invertase Pin-like site-specific DNA recombinase